MGQNSTSGLGQGLLGPLAAFVALRSQGLSIVHGFEAVMGTAYGT